MYKLNKYSLNERYDNLDLFDAQAVDEIAHNIALSSTAQGYTQGPDTTTATGKWFGGVLTPSGKVVMIPLDYRYIGIYDPATDTYTQGPDTSTATHKWAGGVLTPSGKVVMIPLSYRYIGTYNTGYVSKNPTAHLSAYTNKY